MVDNIFFVGIFAAIIHILSLTYAYYFSQKDKRKRHLMDQEKRLQEELLEKQYQRGSFYSAYNHYWDEYRNQQQNNHQSNAWAYYNSASNSQISNENLSKNNQHYITLGINSFDTPADIKKAYRKLMSKYHPDKIASKNLPESDVKRYTEMVQKIAQAYEAICKEKGI